MNIKTKLAMAISASMMAAAGTAVAEVTLYDYTEATSAYEDAYLDGSFNATDGNGHDQTAYNATLSVDYDRVFSSANRNISVNADAEGSISRSAEDGADSESNYLASAGVTADNYFRPGSKGAFWYGSGDLGLKKSADDPFAKIGVGLGYGRVVNVTPMAKSMRLIEALMAQGALSAKPSKATYLSVAQIISRESEYESKYRLGNYEQQWITDIEKALAASGVLNGKLSAAGAIEARDVLVEEFISTRKHGWLVRAGLGLVLSNYDGSDGGDPSLDFEAEYHRPINNQTQFSNVASLSTIFGDDDAGYNLSNEMTWTREVSDKIDWVNAWNLDYSKSGEDGGEDDTTNTLSSTFYYYLNNQLDLKLSAKASKSDDLDDVDTSLNLGASYRLR